MRCMSPKWVWPHRSVEWLDSHDHDGGVSVPCGKCIPCLVNKRQEWSFRLEQEFKFSHGALFITLTYDEKHLRTDGSLNKGDVQLFLKRLRKRDGTNKLRYYCVGEYGSKYGRPHYHLLLFGGSEEHIRKSWTDSKGNCIGIVHVGRVTGASIAYVTKYIIQRDDYDKDLEKPFALMSRRYGLGGRYLSDEMVNWHRENEANYCIRDGVKVRLARFYKSKIWYSEAERSGIGEKGKLLSIQNAEKELNYYRKEFPGNYLQVMTEARDAVIARVKSKVAFTQKF